jgi:hypothetical protein
VTYRAVARIPRLPVAVADAGRDRPPPAWKGDLGMRGFRRETEYRRAREVLARADFTRRGIGERLGRRDFLISSALDLPPWLERTRGLAPLDTLIRLLLLGTPVPADAASRALRPQSLDAWVEAELLTPADREGRVAPRVRLLPFGDVLVASDRPQLRARDARPDHVMPPSLTTVQLAHATLRTPSRRTLDLGTGCGALGLLAASHSEQVVATDCNPRAVAYARFNARLNGIDNVDCREGDLFEPVADERFDLVVCNPPFVIAPTQRFLFRDSGMRGDEFCRRLIRAMPAFLEEGGHGQLICNLAHREGSDWRESLTSWFEGLPCDAIVWLERIEDISEYAMTWLISTETHDVEQLPGLYEAWLRYYRAQKLEAVSYHLVTLRRTAGRGHWIRIDDTPRRIAAPCGGELLETFALQERRGRFADDDCLLGARLRLAPDVHVRQCRAMTSEGLRPIETELEMTGGSRFTLRVEPHVAGLVARCDGTRSVRELLAGMAGASGEAAFPRRDGLRLVRALMDRAILLPGEAGPGPHRA